MKHRMAHSLIKVSEPGWEHAHQDKFSLQRELYSCICNQCRCEEGITEITSLDDLLNTACGLEYRVESEFPV